MPAVLDDVVALLACSVCGRDLERAGAALRCAAGHAFDVARQGYVHLGGGGARALGDTAAMVEARARFLAAGHYDPLSERIVAACAEPEPWGAGLAARGGALLDAGAGPGHHLRALLERLDGSVGIALDASVPAARRAARAHPRIGAVVADTWRGLPVRSGAVALVLDVFAPRNPGEFARVLAPGGALVVVGPGQGHLAELVDALGLLKVAPGKTERLDADLDEHFAPAGRTPVSVSLRLTHAEVITLVGMGPSAWHTRSGALAEAVARLPQPVELSAAFVLHRYRRR